MARFKNCQADLLLKERKCVLPGLFTILGFVSGKETGGKLYFILGTPDDNARGGR
jgi:hypothetical protein